MRKVIFLLIILGAIKNGFATICTSNDSPEPNGYHRGVCQAPPTKQALKKQHKKKKSKNKLHSTSTPTNS